jgi:hypothetical protein
MECRGLLRTPRELFQTDIVSSITRWIKAGDRIILFIDMNEHILNGTLPQEYFCLGLLEATHEYWEDQEPCTFVYGDCKPIDGVYHTPDLTIMVLAQLSFHEGVGDHTTVLVDISTSSMLGKFERRVVPPKARRLEMKNENSVKAYPRFVTTECQRHWIQKRLDHITRDLQTRQYPPPTSSNWRT